MDAMCKQSAPGSQKGASDPLDLEFQVANMNPGKQSLVELQALLVDKPSIQPLVEDFKKK